MTASRGWRLTVFTGAYFSQGVPIGLLAIAVPAWLSAQGMSLSQIAAYQAVIALPWGFKLLAGPFMDRFAFPAMGRRRPWVMAAQAGLVLAFCALFAIDDPLRELTALIAIAFCVNAFAAVQDVAVDGMAIDVLPEAERGRANAFMAFGQVAGFSSFAAICGFVLSRFGLPAAAAVCALTVATIFVLVTAVRERAGERLLPFTEGAASPRGAPAPATFGAIFKGIFVVLFLPMSIVLTLAEWIVRMRDGVAIAVVPVVATQTLGFTAAGYSSLQGVLGVAVAFVGLAIGPLVDRFGARALYLFGIGGSAITTLVFALSQPWWSSTAWVIGLWSAGGFFGQVIFVSFIACAMSICWSRVAASQFAIYMSLSNLARSVGSGLFAPFADRMDVPAQFLLMAALLALAFVVMWFFSYDHHRARLDALEAAPAGS